jgi:hypothetical protein
MGERRFEVAVCIDCAMAALTRGPLFPEGVAPDPQEHGLTPLLWIAGAGEGFGIDVISEDPFFGKFRCDGCHSPLEGDRFEAHAWLLGDNSQGERRV